ncbi:MAG TPA: RagB/SusD family nutrient uptake outer membrane protein [Parapedobacter sp.]|uniref:RagB/SusD family nutrient uptake outer membrane protein n=1 Tax=Parapedobacter sp. TaxID=1958893 RepID=UPI002D1BFBE4|nr:RagB/SusD family nutrient uptake outer membrane protein [Parapedobacter sp.]HWK59206.1 RagB/SusD family nutrient uptake outer membrane protein [Parapedobacter sp.]
MINHRLITCALALVWLCLACGEKFLDVKPNKSQTTPNTVADFQAILDYSYVMNEGSSHELGIIGADEYYLLATRHEILREPYQKNAYLWAENVYEGFNIPDWDKAWKRILYANVVVEGVSQLSITDEEQSDRDAVLGSGLFFRAFNMYQLAQLFCPVYEETAADMRTGLPLRLESDINVRSVRSTLRDTYMQIAVDLERAADLLPVTPLIKYRPSRPAAYALLARLFLQTGEYEKSGRYADACLQLRNDLLDFNSLEMTASYPFTRDYEANPEIIFFCHMDNIAITSTSNLNMDTVLLGLYGEGDLRKEAYFSTNSSDGRILFKGSYFGQRLFFTGLATDEVYLIRAESLARQGQVGPAMEVLNRLLEMRMAGQSFSPLMADNAEEALGFIINERRKELVFRGTRWEDLRRLNKEPRFAQGLRRVLYGNVYELLPGGLKYTWPIPDNEIMLTGMKQNPR